MDSLGNVYQIKNINRNVNVQEVVKYADTMYNKLKKYNTTSKAMSEVIKFLVEEGVFEYEEK